MQIYPVVSVIETRWIGLALVHPVDNGADLVVCQCALLVRGHRQVLGLQHCLGRW